MQPQFRHRRHEQIFQRPKSRARTLTKTKSNATIEFPSIYSRQMKHKRPEVSIDNENAVRRQISKVVSFKKDRVTCLLPELYAQLPEKMKPVGYSSPEYQEKLSVVNRILGSCDLNAKERDLMIARGQQSESIYVFFTNFIYHPLSLCCDQTVILKCNEKRGIQTDEFRHVNRWQFVCVQCFKVLLRLTEHEEKPEKQELIHLRKKKLLDFALHVASGRYKKHMLEEDPSTLSYEHIKSRFKYIKTRKSRQNSQ